MLRVKMNPDGIIMVQEGHIKGGKMKSRYLYINTATWMQSRIYTKPQGKVSFHQKMTDSSIQWIKDNYISKVVPTTEEQLVDSVTPPTELLPG